MHCLILSDSLSCVNAVENRSLDNPLVVEILERVYQHLHVDQRITFVWVPSHTGNTAVDAVAKAGVSLLISNAEIPHTDFEPFIPTTESRKKLLATVLELGYQQ
jgi:hypothetical protein